MSLSNVFDISKSSLVGLKAELAKKQEEVKKLKELQQNYIKPTDVPKEKKKAAKQKSNKGVERRNLKDVEALVEDFDDLKKSREVLEAKSKLYDKLKEACEQNDPNSQYLIDFSLKNKIYPEAVSINEGSNSKEESIHELEEDNEEVYHSDENSDPENDWVDFVDTLGRSRRCLRKDLPQMEAKDAKFAASLRPPSPPSAPEVTPELLSWDMQREMMRKKWEEQETVLLGKKDIHYQDIRFDEARPHGVGYFEFSTDESKRLQQQEELTNLRKETLEQQEAALGLRARRQQQLQARLAAARRRRRERLGLPPDEPDVEEAEPPASSNIQEEKTEEQVKDIEEKIKRIAPVRPWDIGKTEASSVMSQEEWVEMKRQERPEEFAPPLTLLETMTSNKKNLNFFTTKKEKCKPTHVSEDDSEDQNIGPNVEDWQKATSKVDESRQTEKVNESSYGHTQCQQEEIKEQFWSDNIVEDFGKNAFQSDTTIGEETPYIKGGDWKETSDRIDALLSKVKAETCRDTFTKNIHNLVEDNSNTLNNQTEEDCFGPSVEDWNKSIKKQNVISVKQSNFECAPEKQNVPGAEDFKNNLTSYTCNSRVIKNHAMQFNRTLNHSKFNKRKNNYEIMEDDCVNDVSISPLSSSSSTVLSDPSNNTKASKRKWAEIPPPPSMSYFINDSAKRKQNTSGAVNIQESISVGMNYLKARKDEEGKKRVKGLLDII